MKLRKRILIGIGILAFLSLIVLNVQLVQTPGIESGSVDLTLMELSANAGCGGDTVNPNYCTGWQCLLDYFWRLIYKIFGIHT